MFTGIIEAKGEIAAAEDRGANRSFWIHCPFRDEIKIDQSIAHDGVCLTVDKLANDAYRVTSVAETLDKTTAHLWQQGDLLNLERSLVVGSRLDGHFVQGHVDAMGECIAREETEGNCLFTFVYPEQFYNLLVEKGSIAVNGVSLTAFHCEENRFTVTIIPYTLEHTTFGTLQPHAVVNLEFDILGKYLSRGKG